MLYGAKAKSDIEIRNRRRGDVTEQIQMTAAIPRRFHAAFAFYDVDTNSYRWIENAARLVKEFEAGAVYTHDRSTSSNTYLLIIVKREVPNRKVCIALSVL